MNRFFPSLLAALTFTLGASVALADVAPPDCYVEHCTVDQKTQPGTTCTTCENNFMNASDYCQKQVGADYAYACQAWGGSQWQEVWCKGPPKASGTGGGSGTGGDCTGGGGSSGTTSTTTGTGGGTTSSATSSSGGSSGGCAMGTRGDPWGGLTVGGLLAAAAVLLRRRKRS